MGSKKLIVIVGPTAVGKTGLAIRLAKRLGTEIVSADSRQIYSELVIGTAKPSADELKEVPHYFVGVKLIGEEYDAGQYGRDALTLIHQLFEKHNEVILCGGSGLYIKAVTEGFDELPDVPPEIREKIMKEYDEKGLSWLQDRVKEIDPEYFSIVDQKNPHRLVRALELNYVAGKPVGELRQRKKHLHPFAVVKVGLELDREALFRQIDVRMDKMIETGLFEEAKLLYSRRDQNALQTVGYQEVFGFLDGLYDQEEAIRLLKRNSRRYAKRQLTWFKKDPETKWFNPEQLDEIVKFVSGLESPNWKESLAAGKRIQ